ncbi:ATPase complex subunit [Perilla frutescens var. hirtella]|nr:ATPase complex subunit [Perilla frutescens var. frutescens]KAH6776574.1 ATPase complex subunit [Perilla frutescens var. hirtella]
MLRLRRIISAAPRNVNGGNLLKKEKKIFPIIPMHHPSLRIFARFLDIHELATKTAIERSRARLKDEISRGYFQDMKDMEKHGGKVSKANKIIIPASSAIKFPTLEVNFPDGSCLKLPLTSDENDVNASASDNAKGYSLKLPLTSKANDTNASMSDTAKVSLLCLSFRASSSPMLDSWISPFLETFAHSSDVRLYEVSFIDSWLLSRWLIRKLLLKFMKKRTPGEKQDALHRQLGYAFGDHYYFRKELQIINLLTGYIFLVDKHGRIRWQGSGVAAEDELLSLLTCTSLLLEEN